MYSTEDNDNPGPDERVTQMGEDQGSGFARVCEVEVTEAMIEAGELEYYGGSWDRGPESYPGPSEKMLAAIYRAMVAAKGSSSLG